jgi:hypothetical protein
MHGGTRKLRRIQVLSGAWTATPVARVTLGRGGAWLRDTSDLPEPSQLPVPGNWARAGLPEFFGTVRYEREFAAPD